MPIKLAIFSPRQSATTETFIKVHRDLPGMDVLFYHNGIEKAELEGVGRLLDLSFTARLRNKLAPKFKNTGLSITESSVAQSLLSQGAQCVLAEYGTTGARILPIVQAVKLPLVVQFHGFDASMYHVLELNAEKYKEMFSYASAVVAVSRVMRDKLIALRCPKHKVILNHYGASNLFLNNQTAHKEKLFVALGRFVDKKAPYYTILAFIKVLEKHPDARLVIGGDGPLYNTCMNLCRYHGVEGKVSLPGKIDPEDFLSLLSRSIAFVQHSITALSGDMEGTPISVLEASAAGIPVVATRHAGISDVVVHQETGLLCEEHDVDAMARHMLQLADDISLANQYGLAARQRFLKNFTMERHLSMLSDIITTAVNTSEND